MDELLARLEPWERDYYDRLLAAAGDVELTQDERRLLVWLASWDDSIVSRMCSIFERLREE